jgi:hypothetical protein
MYCRTVIAKFYREFGQALPAPTARQLTKCGSSTGCLSAHFLVWNALQLASTGEQYDTVLDRGLFHAFDDEDRRSFVDNLAAVIRPGGPAIMLRRRLPCGILGRG